MPAQKKLPTIETHFDSEIDLDSHLGRRGAWIAKVKCADTRYRQAIDVHEEAAVLALLNLLGRENLPNKRKEYYIKRHESFQGIAVPPSELHKWQRMQEPNEIIEGG